MIQLDNSAATNCDTRPPRCCALECRQCDAAIIGSNLTRTTTMTSTNLGGRIYGEKFDMLISINMHSPYGDVYIKSITLQHLLVIEVTRKQTSNFKQTLVASKAH